MSPWSHSIPCQDTGALNVTDIPRTLKGWREPRHAEMAAGGKTAWRLFNAVTETIKGGLWRLPTRTEALHDVLDDACGLAAISARNSGEVAVVA